MALKKLTGGPGATVLLLLDQRNRSAAEDFLDGLQESHRRKFHGNFGTLLELGLQYTRNPQRFKAIDNPLWEFKEHDHRLYCLRKPEGKHVYVVLLRGWTKDKRGRQEAREIALARSYLDVAEDALNGWLHQQRRDA